MVKKYLRTYWLLLLTVAIYLWCFAVTPERAERALFSGVKTFGSVLMLILAVFCLIGLLQVWISREQIVRVLGQNSGFKGLGIAVLCGAFLMGPPYIIFPLLLQIREQGARWAVVVTVLSCYAVKLQMLPVEAQFLGWGFTLLRSLIIVVIAIPVGLLIERIMERSETRL